MSLKKKRIQKLDIKDRPISQYLERLADGVDGINDVPFINGIKFNTTISSGSVGSTHSVKHGMKEISGWFPLRTKSLQVYNIFEIETDNDSVLTFDTSAVQEEFDLVVWIF